MTLKKQIGKAVALYESFRERKPKRIGKVSMSVPKAVACIGYVEGIDYRTTHGKKVTLYHHDFAPGSRPLFAVSPDGKQLILLGGRFKFTERGIVDRDAQGQEIEHAGHGKYINPRREPPPVPKGLEICERCGGQGYDGFEEDSGKPFSCYACGESGYVPAGSQEDLKRRDNPGMTTRQHFLAWAKSQNLPSRVKAAMWKIRNSEPEYWDDKGWPALLHTVDTSLWSAGYIARSKIKPGIFKVRNPGKKVKAPPANTPERKAREDAIAREHAEAVKRAADAARKGNPASRYYHVEVWEERDRLHISVQDETGYTYADWWDDDARQMFDDGFFDRRRLEASVVEYAEEMGMLVRRKKRTRKS